MTGISTETQMDSYYSFPIHCHIGNCKELHGYTIALSTNLQGRAEDVIHAYHAVDDVAIAIGELRQQIDEKFEEWYRERLTMAETIQVEPKVPRTCSRQKDRVNTPASTPEDYY